MGTDMVGSVTAEYISGLAEYWLTATPELLLLTSDVD